PSTSEQKRTFWTAPRPANNVVSTNIAMFADKRLPLQLYPSSCPRRFVDRINNLQVLQPFFTIHRYYGLFVLKDYRGHFVHLDGLVGLMREVQFAFIRSSF